VNSSLFYNRRHHPPKFERKNGQKKYRLKSRLKNENGNTERLSLSRFFVSAVQHGSIPFAHFRLLYRKVIRLARVHFHDTVRKKVSFSGKSDKKESAYFRQNLWETVDILLKHYIMRHATEHHMIEARQKRVLVPSNRRLGTGKGSAAEESRPLPGGSASGPLENILRTVAQ
jgi:hypothetical protein